MKRPVFIIIGAILVFVLLAVWLYVLFFSTTENTSDSFADFDFVDTTNTPVDVEPDEQPFINITGPERLRQLTTKPVAGYQEVLRNASSTPEVYYIEQGTGHIYSIDLTSGEEKRRSGTTFKESVAGAITPNGQFVMIQSGRGTGSEVNIGEISSTSEALVSHPLTENIIDFKATSDNTFLYAVQTTNSVIGKHYYPISDTSETLFTIPFREATIKWGDSAITTHYAYPKASSRLEGFVYQIRAGKLKRLPIGGFGLSVSGNDSIVLYSKQNGGVYQSYLYDIKNESLRSFSLNLLPDKCVSTHDSDIELICGAELTTYNSNIPDTWYSGTLSYADSLWEIEITDENIGSARMLSNLTSESGIQLDTINLLLNKSDSRLYFTNKNGSALWLYEITSPGEESGEEIDTPLI